MSRVTYEIASNENMLEEYEWDYQSIYDFAIEEEMLLRISKENKIPMSFIVGRLAKNNIIDYKSKLYNKYKLV